MKPTTAYYNLTDRTHYYYFDSGYQNRNAIWTWNKIQAYLTRLSKEDINEYVICEAFHCCKKHGIPKEPLIEFVNQFELTRNNKVLRRHFQDILFLGIVATSSSATMHETLHLLELLEAGSYTARDGILYLLRAQRHKEVVNYINWLPDAWRKIEKQVRPFLTPALVTELQSLGYITQLDSSTDIIASLVSNSPLKDKASQILALTDKQWEHLCSYAHPKKNPNAVMELLAVGRLLPDSLHLRMQGIAATREVRPLLAKYAAKYPEKYDATPLFLHDLEVYPLTTVLNQYSHLGVEKLSRYILPNLLQVGAPKTWKIPSMFKVMFFNYPLYTYINAELWSKILSRWLSGMSEVEAVGLYFWMKEFFPTVAFPQLTFMQSAA